MDSWAGLSYALGRKGNAYRDWIAPFMEIDDGLLDSAAWVEFWLHLADKSAVPRQWMRWAHSFAGRFRKVTPGSPGDTQLFTYFLDTDIVITADKALLDILDECRPYAPCLLPEGQLVPAGAKGVRTLLAQLERFPLASIRDSTSLQLGIELVRMRWPRRQWIYETGSSRPWSRTECPAARRRNALWSATRRRSKSSSASRRPEAPNRRGLADTGCTPLNLTRPCSAPSSSKRRT